MDALYEAALVDALGVARGQRELLPLDTPSAGGGFTRTIDGRYIVRPLALHFRIVTDATVANRTVYVQYRDTNGVAFASMLAPVNVTASTTVDFAFWRGLGQADWIGTTPVTVPLMEAFLLPSWQLAVAIDGVQAGDQLSRIRLYQEEFPTDRAH